jgi:hypothetical protein
MNEHLLREQLQNEIRRCAEAVARAQEAEADRDRLADALEAERQQVAVESGESDRLEALLEAESRLRNGLTITADSLAATLSEERESAMQLAEILGEIYEALPPHILEANTSFGEITGWEELPGLVRALYRHGAREDAILGWGVWHADDEAWIGWGATHTLATDLIPESPEYDHLKIREASALIVSVNVGDDDRAEATDWDEVVAADHAVAAYREQYNQAETEMLRTVITHYRRVTEDALDAVRYLAEYLQDANLKTEAAKANELHQMLHSTINFDNLGEFPSQEAST